MIYNIKIYNNYSYQVSLIQNVQYDSDKNILICNGENTDSMEPAIVGLTHPRRYTLFLSKDSNNLLFGGENDGLVYDMVKSIEFNNLEKTVYACTNILTTGDKNSIVRVDHILRNSSSTEYFITQEGWDAIKNIVVLNHGENRNKLFDHNTLFLNVSEAKDIFKMYSNIIRNKCIYLKEEFNTHGIQEIQENYVYVLSLNKNYGIYDICNTFVSSHIFYNDTEYITDEDGYVDEQHRCPICTTELMRIDNNGIISDRSFVIIKNGVVLVTKY